MKTKLLLLSLLTSVFATQIQAQGRTSVNAMNSEISDNLDLRAIASIFGDSRDLQDFERRLNDPKLQISNLDLNNDDEVDYLRVIESVENRTHVIIIQSVIDQDLYQDVATIDVEKDRYNNVHVQIIGDEYLYGENYIYEPVYHTRPFFYASFWSFNYRPYYSTWNWNYYPSYYYAWNPYPVYRYRSNINICLNINNNYNYVSSRRSNIAINLYSSRRSNGYERQYPNYAFSRRNAQVTNRYELDQRRGNRDLGSRNESVNSRNRTNSSREAAPQRGQQRDYSQNRTNPSGEAAPQRGQQRDYSQNRTNPSGEAAPQRGQQRDYSQNRTNPSAEAAPQRGQQRDYSQNRNNNSGQAAPQRQAPQRDYSQNKNNNSREAAPQRTESQRGNSENRNSNRRS